MAGGAAVLVEHRSTLTAREDVPVQSGGRVAPHVDRHRRADLPTHRDRVEDVDLARLAVDETVILLHPPLPLVGVSIVMERERQQNDRTLANGYSRRGRGDWARRVARPADTARPQQSEVIRATHQDDSLYILHGLHCGHTFRGDQGQLLMLMYTHCIKIRGDQSHLFGRTVHVVGGPRTSRAGSVRRQWHRKARQLQRRQALR